MLSILKKTNFCKNNGFRQDVLLVFCILFFVCPVVGYEFSEDPFHKVVEVVEPQSLETRPIHRVCELIYRGEFSAAGELIRQMEMRPRGSFAALLKIVQEYEKIDQKRQLGRQEAYAEQLAELEKLRSQVDVNSADFVADNNDSNDSNDTPNFSKALSVIAKASEFADKRQKTELLANPFVKQTFQKAMDKASEYESKGDWLNAYVSCYSWLQAIDKDNKAYSDYAEQLLEKANIVASFQNSTCETSEQRYAGVKKEMFIKAIDILNFNYVSIIPYREMALKALGRCNLLTEVVKLSFPQIQGNENGDSSLGAGKISFSRPDGNQLSDWSAGISAMTEELKQSIGGMNKDMFIDVSKKVFELNKSTIKLPQTVIVAQFAEAALHALDPYTVMIWPKRVEDFEKSMTNTFTGIGVEISKKKGFVVIMSLLFDTPAFNSGRIDAGDVIEAIDGVSTKDMSLTCVVKNITGPAGTKVVLTIRHPDEDKREDITITRARVIVPTIRGWQRTQEGKWRYMIDEKNKIGYIRLASFSGRTASDFGKILDRLESEGLNGLVLDLRLNPGGLLDVAAKVADNFIKDGLIVSTRPRVGFGSYLSAHKKGTRPNYPLVVLINSGSASASEIVAGALADKKYNRAVLVGERTHGKGSVQTITHRSGGKSQLKYTMAYYHLPSGQRVESKDAMKKQGREDWGVGPDIEVKLLSNELKKMYEIQKDNDVLVKAGHNNSPNGVELKKHTIEQTLACDHQLAVGVLVVKAQLIERGVAVK